ncbi:hypothetical protein XH80_02410 [Bradyrhizobium sp. CCBAU 45384]|nr:hypothetical protein [Bradyrhizobium sp. CCBAU 45384]
MLMAGVDKSRPLASEDLTSTIWACPRSGSVVLFQLSGAAMDRTVRVGSRKHASGLQLLRLGLMADHVARATKLDRFRGSR